MSIDGYTPPVRDLSLRKRQKPGRDISAEDISEDSHVSQMQNISMWKRERTADNSLILSSKLRILIERILRESLE